MIQVAAAHSIGVNVTASTSRRGEELIRSPSNLIGYERSSFNAATAYNVQNARVSGL